MAVTATHSDEIGARAWDIFRSFMESDEGKRHPEAGYRELHAMGDHFRLPDGTVLVVGYDAAGEVLRSSSFVKGVGTGRYRPAFSRTTPEQDQELFEIGSDVGPTLTALDPPDHTRLRAIVQRSFMPRHVRAVEDDIPVVIDRLLTGIDPRRPVDIVSQFAIRFAPEIMAQLIGLPNDRREEVSALSAAFMRGIDPGCDFAMRKASVAAGRAKRDIIREVIADRRANPRDDVVTSLTQAAGEQMSEPELVALLQVLYLGGYETTSHMIGNGLVRLMQNREQFEALSADPGLAKRAVEEMLRLDSAISLTKSVAAEGAVLRGAAVAPGTSVLVLFGAANRDPNVFPEPDRFDIFRAGKPHLAFGGGIHYCLGVNLARLELEKVFQTFAARFPRMQLADPQPRRTASFLQRSYDGIEVILEP